MRISNLSSSSLQGPNDPLRKPSSSKDFKLGSKEPGDKFLSLLKQYYKMPLNPSVFNDALNNPKLRQFIEEALIDGKNMAAINVQLAKNDLQEAEKEGDEAKIAQAKEALEWTEIYLTECTQSCEDIKNPSYNFEDFKNFCYRIVGPPS